MLRIQEYLIQKQLTESKLLFNVNSILYDNALEFINGAVSVYIDETEKNMFAVIEEAKAVVDAEKASVTKLLEKYKTEEILFEKQNINVELENQYGINHFGLKSDIILEDSQALMSTKLSEAMNSIAALAAVADAYVGLINTATQSVVGVIKE
jgi:hypothetical protein